ncbi:hypothetical protein ANO11243_028010 [Dothideomycetidae sp. 11243]|nr:hypothetical protein ANO11243_028010 [fungal sp. No.11243]
MAHRYLNVQPPQDVPVPRHWARPTTPVKEHSSFVRPLSDIREITEPSIVEITHLPAVTARTPSSTLAKQTALRQAGTSKRNNSVRIVEPSGRAKGKQQLETRFSSSTASEDILDGSSSYSIPPTAVPPRSSSHTKSAHPPRGITIDGHTFPAVPNRIPDRGRSSSPVRQVGERLDPVTSSSSRRVPSHTFVRDPCPFEIVDQPILRHNRVLVQLQVVAPLFVGGGSIEGFVRLVIDGGEWTRHKRNLLLARIAVDLIGVEELLGQHRRSIFLCLATELVDAQNPPPKDMVESTISISSRNPHWILRPSFTLIPFRISLPLDVGPAPFNSKTAQIRYMLCASIRLNENARPLLVRMSQDMVVLSTYDRECLRSSPDFLKLTADKPKEPCGLYLVLSRHMMRFTSLSTEQWKSFA